MSRLYGWIAFAFSLLGAALLYMVGQRDKARQKAREARVEREAVEAARDVEASISKAKQAAREESEHARKERESRPVGTRPSGSFNRLHDDESG